MAERYQRQDALAHRALAARAAPDDASLSLWQEPYCTQLALRGDVSDKRFVAAISNVTGADATMPANTVSRGTRANLLWMGPDEWLMVAAEDATLHAALEEALVGVRSLVSDVTSSRTILGLAGAHARDVLAKGCSLDLHARSFPVDGVAQTALARTHAMLHRLDERPSFHIYVHRSFADYAFRWLEDAAAEYSPVHGGAGPQHSGAE